MSEPTFFETPARFRAWLERRHQSAGELSVGFHKVAIHRVVSAKAEATRAKRLAILIDASAEGRKLGSPTK